MQGKDVFDSENSERILNFADVEEVSETSSEAPPPPAADNFNKDVVKEKLKQLLQFPTLEQLEKMKPEQKLACQKNTFLRMRLLHTLLKPPDFEDDSYKDMLFFEMGDDEVPVFNVNAFRKIYKTVKLEWQGKCILMKPAEFRTGDEIQMVKTNLESLPFFEKYSKQTHFQLAQCLMYQNIPPNRTVVQQGHLPLAFYFIISGGMYAELEEKDKSTGVSKTRILADLKPGFTFGELALIHNSRRTASVKTKFQTEVLFLYKEDFEKILQSNEKNLWWSRYNALTALPYFKRWTPMQFKDLCDNSKNVIYPHNKVIIGDISHSRLKFFYIVMEGKCVVLETLRVVHRTGKAEAQKLASPPINMTTQELNDCLAPFTTYTNRVVEIMTLGQGSYFGAGEDLRRRYIVTSGKTELMVIPHVYLLSQGHGTWLDILEDTLRHSMPSHSEIFHEFVKKSIWRSYKKGLMRDILKTRKLRGKMKDVPVSIKIQERTKDWATLQNHFFR